MAAPYQTTGAYKQIAASAQVVSAPGELVGIFVSAASATPTITIYDATASGTTSPIVSVFTPVAGTWYPLPFQFQNGLNVVISGTVSCTVCYRP